MIPAPAAMPSPDPALPGLARARGAAHGDFGSALGTAVGMLAGIGPQAAGSAKAAVPEDAGKLLPGTCKATGKDVPSARAEGDADAGEPSGEDSGVDHAVDSGKTDGVGAGIATGAQLDAAATVAFVALPGTPVTPDTPAAQSAPAGRDASLATSRRAFARTLPLVVAAPPVQSAGSRAGMPAGEPSGSPRAAGPAMPGERALASGSGAERPPGPPAGDLLAQMKGMASVAIARGPGPRDAATAPSAPAPLHLAATPVADQPAGPEHRSPATATHVLVRDRAAHGDDPRGLPAPAQFGAGKQGPAPDAPRAQIEPLVARASEAASPPRHERNGPEASVAGDAAAASASAPPSPDSAAVQLAHPLAGTARADTVAAGTDSAQPPAAGHQDADFETLLTRLERAREAAPGSHVRTAVSHAELGRLTLDFHGEASRFAVTVSGQDSALAPAIHLALAASAEARPGGDDAGHGHAAPRWQNAASTEGQGDTAAGGGGTAHPRERDERQAGGRGGGTARSGREADPARDRSAVPRAGTSRASGIYA